MEKINPLDSKKQVARAGETLRDSTSSIADRNLSNKILSNWRAIHSYLINAFQATLRDTLRIIDSNSIIAKLKRFEGIKLSRMQDIGGLRAVVKFFKKVYVLRDI